MSDYLHEEVVAEILKRLPVKTLLKFTSVCKSWYALITNPNFISLHLAHTTESNRFYHLVINYFTKSEFVLHNDNESFSEYKQLDLHSFSEFGNDVWMVGSCNGLICLSSPTFKRLIVWNPTIGEFITTSYTEICEGLTNFFGFGFDKKTSDYKVVRIVYAFANTASPPIADIFELSSNSWKTVTGKNLHYDVNVIGRHVELNGVFYWFVRLRNGRKKMITSFDLSNEAFQELMPPHALAEIDENHSRLIVYSQSLAMVHYDKWKRCSIWVMKEYDAAKSWTQQYIIDLENHGGFGRVLSVQGNGGIVIAKRDGEIASYDPQTQRVTPLGIDGRYFKVHSYTESLVLLKGKRNKVKQV
ncbi:F-box/kelch-repeat protein At3g06240-like [Mercurialis annua]|uniref:F-box/kelch-repeat protein At3g06240-like n=1 Tax=Mercurialis annua TaxID=3986 RepID=UPI00215E9918|nr:F-box/kelch-repeat protein At3g06240-like [Mercurialis annua]